MPHVTAAAQARRPGRPGRRSRRSATGSAGGWPSWPPSSTRARYVVGGGVSEAGDLLLAPARAAFVAHLIGADVRPIAEILTAELGNLAGLVGAADLARARD